MRKIVSSFCAVVIATYCSKQGRQKNFLKRAAKDNFFFIEKEFAINTN